MGALIAEMISVLSNTGMRRTGAVRWRAGLTVLSMALVAAACGGGGTAVPDSPGLTPAAAPAAPTPASTPASTPLSPAPPASAAQVAGASVVHTLEVPAALAEAPFNERRTLAVPPGFGITLWARVPQARFMALAPNGDVLVSVPSAGKIVLLRARDGDLPQQFDYATGLRNPHDMVFHTIGDVTYLYVAESNRVTRSVYRAAETASGERVAVVDNLPDASTPELRGNYGHQLKNIALSPDHKLYVSIASTCNACTEDTVSDPVRGAIYQYRADGQEGRLFARGLRNAEGLDFLPGTTQLWVTVNNRDEIGVPIDIDLDGDKQSDLGKRLTAFIDNNPPELFTAVREGAHYGWPFCNAVGNDTLSNLSVLPDIELNRQESAWPCAAVAQASKGIRAHAAPLGLSFLHATKVPEAYRSGAVIALHGCWNCSTLQAGYKVVYFPFDPAGNAGNEIDLVAGFVTDPVARRIWGRPVDAIADAKGNILISDDYAGAIYQLYPKQ